MELLVDVVVEAHRFHALDVTGPRAIAEPVEHVQDALLFSQPEKKADLPVVNPSSRVPTQFIPTNCYGETIERRERL